MHPAQEGTTTLSKGHFKFDLTAGAAASDAVVIENQSASPLVMHIYPADLIQAQGGTGVAPTQEGAALKGAGAWLKVDKETINLAPGQQETDTFTVTVPGNASAGDQSGAIVAATNIGSNGSQTIQARVALITEVVVPGSAQPIANLATLTRIAGPGANQMSFSIDVNNTGNVMLTQTGVVTVVDSDGKSVASLPLRPSDGYIIPTGTLHLHSDAWTQPSGPGQLTIQAHVPILYNKDPVTTLLSNVITVGTPRASVLPWILGAVAVVLVIAGGGTVLWRRRRARGRAELAASEHDQAHALEVKERLRNLD